MTHKRTKCIKLRPSITHKVLARWKCPKCKLIFQCGDNKKDKEMYCDGLWMDIEDAIDKTRVTYSGGTDGK